MVSFFFVFLQIEKVKNKNKKGDMKKQGLLFVLLALTACASAQNTFSKDYGIVGEGEDKVYIANNIRDYYVDVEDFFDTTYLLAFDLITGKKDTLMSFETASYTGMGFIDFSYYESKIVLFSVTEGRAGSSLYFIDVYNDRVEMIADGIVSDDKGDPKIYVKDGRLYFTRLICINEAEARDEASKEFFEKEFSIRLIQ